MDRRSKSTQPGEFKHAQRKHKATQARRDALAQLRAGEVVEVSAYDETVYGDGLPRKVQVRPFEEGEPCSGQRVLCLHNQRLRVMWYYVKDGEAVGDSSRGHAVHPPYKDLFGVVT